MMNKVGTAGGRPFTGWHMAGLLLLFFWRDHFCQPDHGLVRHIHLVRPRRQEFLCRQSGIQQQGRQVKAQEALGWKGRLEASDGMHPLDIR